MNKCTRHWAAASAMLGLLLVSSPVVHALGDPQDELTRRSYADIPLGQIHYRFTLNKTDATPLVLLHQSPLSGRMFRNLLPLLGKTRQSFAVDTPGYGESDPPAAPPTIAGYTDALVAWMDAIGLQQIDLFGYHTGSVLAVDIAVRYPERVRKLMLMSVPLMSVEQMQNWTSESEPFDDQGQYLAAMWNGSFHYKREGQSNDDIAVTVAEKQRAGRTHKWAYAAMGKYSLAEQAIKIEQPLLLLNVGDTLFEATADLKRLLERNGVAVEYLEKPDWSYGLFDTEATEITQLIDDFTAQTDSQ